MRHARKPAWLRLSTSCRNSSVFRQVFSTGSFTAAARALAIPKSSVARQMMRLEDELGCKLIARTTRTVALTDEGLTFLPHARRLLDNGIEAKNVLRINGDGAYGLLAVTAPSTFGQRFLAPYLPAFRKRHPNVQISLRLTSAKVEMGVGQTDIAIRLGPLVEPNLGARRLGYVDFCLVASREYLKDRPPPSDPIELTGHELLELRPPAAENRLELYRDGEMRPVRCVPAIQIDDPESVKAATLAGVGIAALPAFLVIDELKAGKLVRVLAGWAPAPAPVHILYSAKSAPPLRVQAYMDFFYETVGRNMPWQTETFASSKT